MATDERLREEQKDLSSLAGAPENRLAARQSGIAATMKDHELISAIRDNSDLRTPEDVEKAAHATLSVLGQRLSGGAPLNLGSQLPTTFAEDLAVVGEGERFTLDEFYSRVARIEGTDVDHARHHARAVMAGVRTAVERTEFDNLLAQLPADYDDLVFTGPVH